jgi:hypothetical protein
MESRANASSAVHVIATLRQPDDSGVFVACLPSHACTAYLKCGTCFFPDGIAFPTLRLVCTSTKGLDSTGGELLVA